MRGLPQKIPQKMERIFEQKTHFLTSISPAIENLKYILTKLDTDLKISELKKLLTLFFADLKGAFCRFCRIYLLL
jgi:hypothetical protein